MHITIPAFTLPVAIFVTSAVLLVCGLLAKVRSDAVHLSFLDRQDLSSIERDHPYLPSLRVVAGIAVCSGTLFAVALQSFQELPAIGAVGGWVYLAAFFAVLASLGVLAELHWGAGEYAFAVTLGTAVAFLLLVLQRAFTSSSPTVTTALVLLLLSTVVAAWLLFYKGWSTRIRLTAGLTVLLWCASFLLR
jgi:hypothetical protein